MGGYFQIENVLPKTSIFLLLYTIHILTYSAAVTLLARLRLLLLTLALCSAVPLWSQSHSSPSSEATRVRHKSTAQMVSEWLENEENDQLAALFAVGDQRSSDLLEICRTGNDESAGAAFFVLQMLEN
jgi:hypothetical protein